MHARSHLRFVAVIAAAIVDEHADAWFAYVVKAVDLLFGAGFEEVHLPQEGLVMVQPDGNR